MTAATPNRAYPYPEGTDFLGDTAAAVEALAEAVDDDVEALAVELDTRGVLGYAQTTTAQNGMTGAALTGLSVAVTVGASRRIRVSGFVGLLHNGGGVPEIQIREGATILQRAFESVGAGQYALLQPSIVLTPSAGAHTYLLHAASGGGTSVDCNVGGANGPSFVLVEDLGPV